ncbi:MAG: crossover junction endodeoxyribonuclease RuvC [Bacteroidales bacterium]|jgi:crossover junction endodeoxyribonuclease RuvC|nr:crossover junction endodeoxyribonuclease RuvC [Bacteroidales bacterium]
MIILGIDPGTLLMGHAVVSRTGSAISYVNMGVLNMRKVSNPTEKLATIHRKIISLIEEYHPDEFSIETPFYGKNPQSLIKLGRAQGVAIAAALSKDVPVFEYAPLKIKQSITGVGRASKEQVWAMLCRILNMNFNMHPKYMDASDALGAAVCHCLQFRNIAASDSSKVTATYDSSKVTAKSSDRKKTSKNTSKNTSWEKFIITNKDRIL